MSVLTRADYEDFLVHLYFGASGDPLTSCLDRAYLDFSRTLHGIGVLAAREALYPKARAELAGAISSLREDAAHARHQDAFDDWHRATCAALAATYRAHGYENFYVGQGQKWINMTLKYVAVMGEDRLPGFAYLYPLCHVPLDNILLGRLSSHGMAALPCAWSRLDDYDCYLASQHWIRQNFSLVPLDTEFLAWMGKPVRRRDTG